MATATERIPVLVTKAQKARIAKKAKNANLPMGEFLRRAANAYDPTASEEAFSQLLEEVEASTAGASQALDDALAFVQASRQRIAKMEAEHAARKSK